MNGFNNMNTAAPAGNVSEQFVTQQLPVGWPWRLLVFSIALFAFALLVYFGVKIGYTAYLEGRIGDVDAALAALTGEVTQEEQEQFVNFYSQIVNLKTALDDHSYGANVFTFLEKNTIPEIQFTGAELNAADLVLVLHGQGPSIDLIGQQLAALEGAPGVSQVLLRDVKAGENVTFTITIQFSADFFRAPLT